MSTHNTNNSVSDDVSASVSAVGKRKRYQTPCVGCRSVKKKCTKSGSSCVRCKHMKKECIVAPKYSSYELLDLQAMFGAGTSQSATSAMEESQNQPVYTDPEIQQRYEEYKRQATFILERLCGSSEVEDDHHSEPVDSAQSPASSIEGGSPHEIWEEATQGPSQSSGSQDTHVQPDDSLTSGEGQLQNDDRHPWSPDTHVQSDDSLTSREGRAQSDGRHPNDVSWFEDKSDHIREEFSRMVSP